MCVYICILGQQELFIEILRIKLYALIFNLCYMPDKTMDWVEEKCSSSIELMALE